MAKRKGDVVRNIEPFHCELMNVGSDGFELWLYSTIGDDYSRRYITKVKFKTYWLQFLAKTLWRVQESTQEKANNEAKALRGEA